MKSHDWQAIRAAHPIAQVVGQSVKLQKVGREFKGLCPFHDEKTPSFHVIPDKEFFHCFGCGAHGDVVDFVRDIKGLSNSEAIAQLTGGETINVSPQEVKRREEIMRQREQAQAMRYDIATREARDMWAKAKIADPHHPYLVRKNVAAYMARQHEDGRLILPVYDGEGEIQSLQFIDDQGGKKFLVGAPMSNGRLYIGINMGRTILCEGFATGASIYDAMPEQVCVAFSLGNMEKLAREFHAQGRTIVLASDTGLAAQKMKALGRELSVPVITPSTPTDFNDQANQESPESVAAAFSSGIREFAEAAHLEALPSPLPLEWAGDTQPVIDGFWLIDDWLPATGIAAIYGHPGSGKSFFALHMAAHVAAGREWAGRHVEQGLVLYVVAEGATGFRNRVYAMRENGDIARDAAFAIVASPIDMQAEKGDVKALIDTIRIASEARGAKPALIVLDTLSKTFGSGKENTDDMVGYVNNCQQVASAFDCLTCVVHHRPKDTESRDLRGHSSLRGNVDTTILVEAGKVKTATTLKQKDGEDNVQVRFKLRPVVIGEDRRGKAVTTCLVDLTGEDPKEDIFSGLNKSERAAFAVLIDLIEKQSIDPETGEIRDFWADKTFCPVPVCSEVWKEALRTARTISADNADTAARQFRRIRKSLEEKGKIDVSVTGVLPVRTGADK